MTKEEFLKNPVGLVPLIDPPPPADWIADAWSNEQFRTNVTSALVRSVSKNGDFFIASYWLEVLPTFLSAPEVVALYEYIRDKSRRLEIEWRPEFEYAFSVHVGVLPARRTCD